MQKLFCSRATSAWEFIAVLLIAGALAGCGSDGASRTVPPLQAADPLPTTAGTFAGSYRVPVSAELAAAASYRVDHVDWTFAAGVATLHYELPVGLVGGKVEVTLSGALSPGTTRLQITGPVGSGTCVATATQVTCHEIFGDLGNLPLSTTVVEQTAAAEYAGPVADRLAIARLFGSDPIGIVIFDTASPAVDDRNKTGAKNGDKGSGADD